MESHLDGILIEDDPAALFPLPPSMERYLVGECHVLAVALHRQFGWEIALVLNDDAFFWEDPADPDNGIPEVIHAYAVDPQQMAWDIRGARPAQEMRRDSATQFGMDEGSLSTDWMRSERELDTYVGGGVDEGGNPFDRPLETYTDQDVSRALEDALRLLSGNPVWPKPPSAPAPRGM